MDFQNYLSNTNKITKTDQNRQVGNAVPPILGQEIAKSISSHLEKQ